MGEKLVCQEQEEDCVAFQAVSLHLQVEWDPTEAQNVSGLCLPSIIGEKLASDF